jgi:hypothetical protein
MTDEEPDEQHQRVKDRIKGRQLEEPTEPSGIPSSIEWRVEILQEAIDDLKKQNVQLSRFIERQSIGFPLMRIYNAIVELRLEADYMLHQEYPGLFWIDDYSINGDALEDNWAKEGFSEVGHGKVMRGPYTYYELLHQNEWWARAAELQIHSGDFVYFELPVINEAFFKEKYNSHRPVDLSPEED